MNERNLIDDIRRTKGRNPLACEISEDIEEVEKFLMRNGFDGLFCPGECACLASDLVPCGIRCNDEPVECEAGYITDGQSEGYDWIISRNPDDSTSIVRKRIVANADASMAEEKPTKPLYKTTIIIWSKYDTSESSLRSLGENAEEGDAYCSRCSCEAVQEPDKDPDFGDTEFFDDPFEDGEDEE